MRGAFTLVELLVAVAILVILIGLLLPALASARHATRNLRCMANLRSLGQHDIEERNLTGQWPWLLTSDVGYTLYCPYDWTEQGPRNLYKGSVIDLTDHAVDAYGLPFPDALRWASCKTDQRTEQFGRAPLWSDQQYRDKPHQNEVGTDGSVTHDPSPYAP